MEDITTLHLLVFGAVFGHSFSIPFAVIFAEGFGHPVYWRMTQIIPRHSCTLKLSGIETNQNSLAGSTRYRSPVNKRR
jgi:hypothetical protein